MIEDNGRYRPRRAHDVRNVQVKVHSVQEFVGEKSRDDLQYVDEHDGQVDDPAERVMRKPDPAARVHAREHRLVPRDEHRNGDEHEDDVRNEAETVEETFVAQNSVVLKASNL